MSGFLYESVLDCFYVLTFGLAILAKGNRRKSCLLNVCEIDYRQSYTGRIFWTLVVTFMLILSTYWSLRAYNDWQNFPVLTTLTTTGYPVRNIEFPAFTICGQVSISSTFYVQVLHS